MMTQTPTNAMAAKKTEKTTAKKAAVKQSAVKAAVKATAKKAPAKKAAAKKSTARKKVAVLTGAKPSLDAIARAAYLNYRRRVDQGLPGDAHSDWVEAERSLGVK